MLRRILCFSTALCALAGLAFAQSNSPVPATEVTISTKADVLAGDSLTEALATGEVFPPAREGNLPRTRWEHVGGSKLWTRALLASLKDHGRVLTDTVPDDIANWCPAYTGADAEQRRAFWAGFISTLVKHESTYKPGAVGGGNLWYGLTQIYPSTARLYKCRARSGAALKHGPSNLSCAVRIMARTVPRDNVVSRGFRGVAADWGPLHSSRKRADMMAWTKRQTYCRPLSSVRPKPRPVAETVTQLSAN